MATRLYIATNQPGTLDVNSDGSVIGTGTQFESTDVGRVITVRTTAGDVRTTIASVTSSTSITLDTTFPQNYTGLYYYLDYQEVDLFEDVPLPLTYSVADIRKPDKRDTSYSKTIRIPGTPENNKLFGHIYEVDIDCSFNANVKALCYLDIDTIEQFRGIAQLLKINTKEGGKIEYELALYGTTGGFLFNLMGKWLSELDLSQYNHNATVSNIQNSWYSSIVKSGVTYNNFTGTVNSYFPNGEPNGEGYVYPLIDTGYMIDDTAPKFQWDRLPVCIYTKTIVDAMFTSAGYTYTSNFLSGQDVTGLFPKLIVYSKPRKRRVKVTVYAPRTYTVHAVSLRFHLRRISVDGVDSLVKMLGTFQDSMTATDNYGLAPSDPDTHEFELEVNDGEQYYFQGRGVSDGIGTGTFITLLSGGYIKFEYANDSSQGVTSYSFKALKTIDQPIDTGSVYDDLVYPNDSTLGGFDFQDVWNTSTNIHTVPNSLSDSLPKVKCVDFFMSIVKMFNLYIDRDRDDTQNLIIEPRDYYYATGGTVNDWTQKLDYSQDIELIPMGELDFRTLRYTYKEDGDFWNTKYKNDHKEIHGQQEIQVDNDFVKNETVNELIFAPTPSVQSRYNEFVVVPSIVKDDPSSVSTPNVYENPLPRILIYGGKRSAGFVTTGIRIGLGWFQDYPYCGMWDDPFNPYYSIMFGLPKEVYVILTSASQLDNLQDLFYLYHSTYVAEIIDKDSKLVIGRFNLNPVDIFNLNFRDRFFVNGHWLRLHKVIEYDPVKPKMTKCEFTKVKKQQPFIAPRPNIPPVDPKKDFNIIEGGFNEVRALDATSFYHVIEGGFNEVRNLGATSPILIVKG